MWKFSFNLFKVMLVFQRTAKFLTRMAGFYLQVTNFMCLFVPLRSLNAFLKSVMLLPLNQHAEKQI